MQKYQVVNLGLPTKTCKCRDRKKAAGAGPGGTCVCPRCGAKVPHVAGQPCTDLTCPVCGNQMIRTSLSGPGETSCVPGDLRRQIEAEEETMRNEAARMERANDQAKASPPAYPPVTTPGSKPVGMRIPTFPFGSLFSSAGISPISMVSPMGPTGYSV